MADIERTNQDGTPTLGTLILWSAQGAEGDGAIGFDQLQDLREVAKLLNEAKVDSIEALRTLLGVK